MGKCILLIRVSSERQEYEAQTDELVQFTKSFGYKDKDIILIQDKESAIKLSEEERQGLNKLKEAINDNIGNVDAVYCWELSRLSRQPKILYSIRDYLLDRKINLIVKEPFLKLLDDNKEPISTSLIQFGFFIALVENEMRDKKARFERGRKNKASQGKYTGGYIRYGYNIEADTKKYIINEEEAHTIKLIYNLYETGKYSHKTIVSELKELGYDNDVANIGKIQFILKGEEYTGASSKRKLKISFPPIITSEQFEKCRQISDGNNTKLNKSNTTIYYSQLLLHCSCCHKNLHPKRSTNLYVCSDKSTLSNFTKDVVIKKCADQNYLNMNYIDSFVWHISKDFEVISIWEATEEQIKNNDLKIDNFQTKLDNIEIRFNDLKKRRNRLGLSFADGMVDEEAYKQRKENLNDEENTIIQDRIIYTSEIERLNNSNNNINKSILTVKKIRSEQEFLNLTDYLFHIKKTEIDIITDDKIRFELIRKHIEKVLVTNVNDSLKILLVKCFDNNKTNMYLYQKVSKNTKPVIYTVVEENNIDFENIEKYCIEENILNYPIVRNFKLAPNLGQYEKLKERMEQDPEYAERKKKNNYYHTQVWRINNKSKLTAEGKEEKIKQLKEKYKEYL